MAYEQLMPYGINIQQSPGNWGGTDKWVLTAKRTHRLRQAGTLAQLDVYVDAIGATTAFYAQVWRQVGATNAYNLVGMSDNLSPQINSGTGTRSLILQSPIVGCQEGDYYGYSMTTGSATPFFAFTSFVEWSYTVTQAVATPPAQPFAWQSQFVTSQIMTTLGYVFTGMPQFVTIGDGYLSGYPNHYTLAEGTNSNPFVPSLTAAYKLGQRWGNGLYQNVAREGDIATDIANRIYPDVIWQTNTTLTASLFYCIVCVGIGDLQKGSAFQTMDQAWRTTWTALLDNGWRVIQCLIPPWTSGTTTQMQTRDSWNTSMTTLRNSTYPSVILVDTSPYLGQFRTGGPTGNLWDIKSAYNNGDGLHLNAAGQTALSDALYNALLANNIISIPLISAASADNLKPNMIERATEVVLVSAYEKGVPISSIAALAMTIQGEPNLMYNGTTNLVTVISSGVTPTSIALARDGFASFGTMTQDNSNQDLWTYPWCTTPTCWGNQPGSHTLYATATYPDASTLTVSKTVNVS